MKLCKEIEEQVEAYRKKLKIERKNKLKIKKRFQKEKDLKIAQDKENKILGGKLLNLLGDHIFNQDRMKEILKYSALKNMFPLKDYPNHFCNNNCNGWDGVNMNSCDCGNVKLCWNSDSVFTYDYNLGYSSGY